LELYKEQTCEEDLTENDRQTQYSEPTAISISGTLIQVCLPDTGVQGGCLVCNVSCTDYNTKPCLSDGSKPEVEQIKNKQKK